MGFIAVDVPTEVLERLEAAGKRPHDIAVEALQAAADGPSSVGRLPASVSDELDSALASVRQMTQTIRHAMEVGL